MRLTHRQVQDVAVIELRGALAGEHAVMALDATIHRLCRLGVMRAIVDLSHVSSVGLDGLSALTDAERYLHKNGAACALAGVTTRLDDLVVITRLLTVFDTYDSVDEAANAMLERGQDVDLSIPRAATFAPRVLRRA